MDWRLPEFASHHLLPPSSPLTLHSMQFNNAPRVHDFVKAKQVKVGQFLSTYNEQIGIATEAIYPDTVRIDTEGLGYEGRLGEVKQSLEVNGVPCAVLGKKVSGDHVTLTLIHTTVKDNGREFQLPVVHPSQSSEVDEEDHRYERRSRRHLGLEAAVEYLSFGYSVRLAVASSNTTPP